MNFLRTHLRPEEVLLGLYTIALVAIYLVLGAYPKHLAGNPFIVAAMIALAFIAYVRGRRQQLEHKDAGRKALRVVRDYTPFIMTVVFYELLHDLTPVLRPHVVDDWIIAIDRAVFGVDPAVFFGRFASVPVTAILTLCYLSYFISQPVMGFLLYRKGEMAQFRQFLIAVCVVGLIGFTGFVLVPVVGPWSFQGEQFPTRLLGEECSWIRMSLDAMKSDARDCFPSLHTAHTTVVLVTALRYSKKLFWAFLPIAVLLYISTMYLRFHYGTDVVFGFVTAAIALSVGPWIERKWQIRG